MPGAGPERGLVVLPEVGDEVLVAFDHGDPRLPYIVGGLFNGKDELPVKAIDGGKVVTRALVSRNGHRIELHDEDDAVTIATGDGKHRLVLDQKDNKIIIETSGDIEVKSDAKLDVSGAERHDVRVHRRVRDQGATASRIDAGGGCVQRQGRARPRSRAAAPSSCRAAGRRPCAARS